LENAMHGLKQRLMVAALAAGAALGPTTGARAETAAPVLAAPAPGAVATVTVTPDVQPLADPLAEAIRALVAGHATTMSLADKKKVAAVSKVYAERDYAPLWVEQGRLGSRAALVIDRIGRAADDGLDPSAYALPDAATMPTEPSPADLAALDVGLSMAVAAFAADASAGRVAPSSIAKDITRSPKPIDAATALAAVAGGGDPVAALDGFNPPNPAFARLKAKLAEVRARGEAPKPEPIASGPTLKPGMHDARVPALRARFGLATATDTPTGSIMAPAETQVASTSDDPLVATVEAAIQSSDETLYDEPLVEAVKGFQAKAGLVSDGIIGSRTLAVLNGEDRDEEGEILANMEMWRWMPRDLGRDHVFVNVPEFIVRVVRDGVQVHQTRVVVGKVANQTPIFSDEMEYLVVNPYWHVPESIKIKEMLPEIQADPAGYFSRHGYEATWEGQVIDPNSVIWDENAVKAVGIRQVPGEANALGNIKFMFPNQHSVYLHDTPSRKLFQRDFRAYSHGCVRVDDPMAFAEVILQGDPEWTVDKLKAMFGGAERRVDLAHHLKVHIGYFNVWVDESGTLQMRDDLYGHAKKVKAALGLTG
jgi:murein L,D-transpeptidase YcbB/YkuD